MVNGEQRLILNANWSEAEWLTKKVLKFDKQQGVGNPLHNSGILIILNSVNNSIENSILQIPNRKV